MKIYKVIEKNQTTGLKQVGTQEIYLLSGITATDKTGKTYKLGTGEEVKYYREYRVSNPKVYILIKGFCVPMGTYKNRLKLIEIINKHDISEHFKMLSEGLDI